MVDSLEFKVSVPGVNEAEAAVKKLDDRFDNAATSAKRFDGQFQAMTANSRTLNIGLLNVSESISKASQKTVNWGFVLGDVMDALVIGGPLLAGISAASVALTVLATKFDLVGNAGKRFMEQMKAQRKATEDAAAGVTQFVTDEQVRSGIDRLKAMATSAEAVRRDQAERSVALARRQAELERDLFTETEQERLNQLEQLRRFELEGQARLNDRQRSELAQLRGYGERIELADREVKKAEQFLVVARATEQAANRRRQIEAAERAEAERERARRRAEAARRKAEAARRKAEADARRAEREDQRFVDKLARDLQVAKDELQKFGEVMTDEERATRERIIEANTHSLTFLGEQRLIDVDNEKRSLDARLAAHQDNLKQKEKAEKDFRRMVLQGIEETERAEAKAREKSRDAYASMYQDIGQNVFGGFVSTVNGLVTDLVTQQDNAFERAAANFLKSTGGQLVGIGTKAIFEGLAISANPLTPGAGAGMVAIGGAAIAAGIGMGAAGAAISAGIADAPESSAPAARTQGPGTGGGGAQGSQGGPVTLHVVNNYGAVGPNPRQMSEFLLTALGEAGRSDPTRMREALGGRSRSGVL